MSTRLQTLNLADFTGGLNLRANEFNLAENESPDILNMEVDPAGGFFTRKGWQRFSDPFADDWDPRNTFFHLMSDGTYQTYLVDADDGVQSAGDDGVFTEVKAGGLDGDAVPHLADFAAWGDIVYIALGSTASAKRDGIVDAVALTDSHGAYNDDYTTPAHGKMPIATLVETHSSYMFAACIKEGGTVHPNRLRWSHPDEPEDWAEADWIDIKAGGSRITGLMSFQDHLLIFKQSSVWALYGYNSDSWQLVRVSESNGAPNATAMTQSETTVFFYSRAGRAGVYAYAGGEPEHISQQLQIASKQITDGDDIWMGWVGRRLWCSLPWIEELTTREKPGSTAFVFDPEIGSGAWTRHRPERGNVTCIVQRSDAGRQHPLAIIVGDETSIVVELEKLEEAVDDIGFAAFPAEPESVAFTARYATGWQFAGYPERRKSWRRPRIIIQRPNLTVSVRMDTYVDYNEAAAARSHVFGVDAAGSAIWSVGGSGDPNGFDWGDGTLWSAATAQGSAIVRASPPAAGLGGLGVNRSMQLRFMTNAESAGIAWGVNAIVLKYILRRLTT